MSRFFWHAKKAATGDVPPPRRPAAGPRRKQAGKKLAPLRARAAGSS
jgi:hypothetical protein